MIDGGGEPTKDGLFWAGRLVAVALLVSPAFLDLSFGVIVVATVVGLALFVGTSWRANRTA